MHPDEFSSKFIRNNTSNLVLLPGSQSQSSTSESNMNETNNSNNSNLDNSNANNNNNEAESNTYNAELLLNLKKNNDHQSKHHDNMLSVNYSPKSNNSLSPGLIINDVHNNEEDEEEVSSLPNREEYSPPISSSPPHENFGSSAASTTSSSSSIIQHSDDLEKVVEVSSPSSSIDTSSSPSMRNSRSQQIKSSANQNDYCDNMSRSPSGDQKMQQQHQHQTSRNLSSSTPSTSLIRKRDGSVNSQTSSGGGTIRSGKLDGISFLLNGSVVKGVSSRKEVIPQRKRRDFIPNELKDDHYWERRRKNNLAAKRSREKRRLNDIVLETKVLELTNANNVLKLKLDLVMRKFDMCDEEMDKLFEENKHLLVVQESLDLHELLGSNDDSNQHMRGDSYDMSNEQSPMSNHQNQNIQSMHSHNNNNESDSSIISNPSKKSKLLFLLIILYIYYKNIQSIFN